MPKVDFIISSEGQEIGWARVELEPGQHYNISIQPADIEPDFSYFVACLSILDRILYVLREGKVYSVIPGPPGGCEGKHYYRYVDQGCFCKDEDPPNEWPRAWLSELDQYTQTVMIIMPQDEWAARFNE